MLHFVEVCGVAICELIMKICEFAIWGQVHLKNFGFARAEWALEFADLRFADLYLTELVLHTKQSKDQISKLSNYLFSSNNPSSMIQIYANAKCAYFYLESNASSREHSRLLFEQRVASGRWRWSHLLHMNPVHIHMILMILVQAVIQYVQCTYVLEYLAKIVQEFHSLYNINY